MKKSIFALASLAMMMASCSNDDFTPASGNEGAVTFRVNVPTNSLSRAYGEAESANSLSYAVYETGKTAPVLSQEDIAGGPNFNVTMNLVKGKTYDFVFWADNGSDSPYTFSAESQSVTVSYDDAKVNDDSRDAFFNAVKGVKITGPMQQTVELRRPFAQINVGTSDLNATTDATVKTTALTVKNAYTSLNLSTGIASESKEASFSGAAPASGETFPVEGNNYDYLAMAYVLTGTQLAADDVQNAQSELMDVDITITTDDNHTINIPVNNAPVQRNYRTNIYGALLTSPLDWTIEIKPGFNDPDFNITEEASKPATNEDGVYLITTQGELAWIAQQVKGGDKLSGKTFSLQNDIYMTGTWTPIGGGGLGFDSRFSGKFLGNGHTIYNMVVNCSERAGFFGFMNGTVEGLNFDNAQVSSNHWAGVVAGYSDNETGSTYIKNCKVTNSTVTLSAEFVDNEWDNGDKGGAIIGFMAAKDQVTNCTVENVTIQGYRDLGGIIGYASGSVITGNTVNGLTILVDNTHNYKNYTTLGTGGNDANGVIGEKTSTATDENNTSSNVTVKEYTALSL